MFSFKGPWAQVACSSEAFRRFAGFSRAVLKIACLTAASVSFGQQQAALTLDEAERLALEREPGQSAYLAQAESLAAQAIVAGQLPDPRLRVGLANFPVESGGFSSEAMTQAQIGFQQSFPPGQSRAASSRRFESLAEEMRATADARGRDVLTGVRTAWLESHYWDRAATIVRESRPLFAQLATVTRSLYALGARDQQDVLRSELELSRLDDRLINIERERAQARAALSEWLPEHAGRPVADSLPDWDALPPLEEFETALERHPAVDAANERIAAREAGVDLAREAYKSGWTLDVTYGYRDGIMPTGAPRSDMLSVGFMVDLPFFRGNRQDRTLAAALSDRRAADESREQLRRRLLSQLAAEYGRWQELTHQLELYDRAILVQTREHAEAALLAYQSETGDFADVMRGYIDELNTRLDYLRLQIKRGQSYAVLANLGGLVQ